MTLDYKMINRRYSLLSEDVSHYEPTLTRKVSTGRFLVIGGAGSIGQAVTKEIFKRNPRCLHIADLSENNLVELVRDLRSSEGYIEGDFRTFAIDCGSQAFERLMLSGDGYDYVLNLSALKHVRSEQSVYTLMRMIDVNILNTIQTIRLSKKIGVTKYFCVSTDKAANPVNMMGASKRIMELALGHFTKDIGISTARFANVLFSDGSLLHGFKLRLEKSQPLVGPSDVKRFFVTSEEAGQLCLLSTLLGESGDIFFPKLDPHNDMHNFRSFAEQFLEHYNLQPHFCESENEARTLARCRKKDEPWPCFFSESTTTGEKPFEEFFTSQEDPDLTTYATVGRVKLKGGFSSEGLANFLSQLDKLSKNELWEKSDFVKLFTDAVPEFSHKDLGSYLDQKM
jgi:FlaA1/EpsC-like NDP-sugar epimerase